MPIPYMRFLIPSRLFRQRESEKIMTTYQVGEMTFEIENPITGMDAAFSHASPCEGVTDITITLKADQPVVPTKTSVKWKIPVVNIHYKWNSACARHRYLDVMSFCYNSINTRANGSAPVMCLHDMAGTNALTFALSDAMHENTLSIALDEKGFMNCGVGFFQAPWDPIKTYTCTLRLDQRRRPYHEVLKHVGDWWEQGGLQRATAPDSASQPFFCTWYSHHGEVRQEDVVQQATLAKPLGVETILIDGGWGVPLEPRPHQFPELARTVKQVQDLGLKVMLWTEPAMSNPANSHLLGDDLRIPRKGARFDPRYPEVRAQWVKEYLHLLDLCGCDGFKIDFIECIPSALEGDPDDPRRDYKSIPEAVDAALREIMAALRARKPAIMLEYRQPYNGPHMLQHCTMMRAVDCGNSYPDNRQRTCDIRLLSGGVPVHSDPITWHPDEPVTAAALHLQHTLFSVPQLSVKLETLGRDHLDMIRTYLAFWRAHRDVILTGEFMPQEPQGSFPAVLARTQKKLLVGAFANTVVSLPEDLPGEILLVNATNLDRMVLELSAPGGARFLTVTSVTGEVLPSQWVKLRAGLNVIEMPPSSYGVLSVYGRV